MKDTVSVGSFSADFCPLSTNYVPTLSASAACSPHNKQDAFSSQSSSDQTGNLMILFVGECFLVSEVGFPSESGVDSQGLLLNHLYQEKIESVDLYPELDRPDE